MDIKKTTREITDYHFRLDGDEMAAMFSDPIAWADELRAELNYQTPLAPTPPPARKGAAKTARGPKGPAKGKGRTGPRGTRVTCPVCEQELAEHWLRKHLATKHPNYQPTPASLPA